MLLMTRRSNVAKRHRNRTGSALDNVSYSLFRRTVNAAIVRRTRTRRGKTWLYDEHNQVVAMMEAAMIHDDGSCSPAQYYIATPLMQRQTLVA